MFRRLVCVAALLSLSAAHGGEPPFGVFTAEPFVADLWEDELPQSATESRRASPLRLAAARGERTSALICIRANQDLAGVEAAAGRLSLAGRDIPAAGVRVRVIRLVPRASVYTRVLGDRYPQRWSRKGGIVQPDVLVRDEPAFAAMTRNWDGQAPLKRDDAIGPVIGAPVKAGGCKYFLFTVAVPDDARPGDGEGSVRIRAGGVDVTVPVRLTVHPFRLAPAQRVLMVSNEFADPRNPHFESSLRLLAGIGATATRITNLVGGGNPARAYAALREHGCVELIENRPATAAAVRGIPPGFNVHFYGLDEPQPKRGRRGREGWDRMAEHVALSRRIHQAGGKVVTSLPYILALELRQRNSRVYQELAKLGVKDVYQPLDWANYGLGIQRVATRHRDEGLNQPLFDYIAQLQKEFREEEWTAKGAQLPSKHPWRETYYLPAGLMRYPMLTRLLNGFYLFNTHFDGVMNWTLYRVRGRNPFEPTSMPVASLAYPAEGGFYSTYTLEAVGKGIDDLRYARTAYEAIASLLSGDERRQARGRKLRARLLTALAPWETLAVGGRRIDLVRDEKSLRQTREALVGIILDAQR